MNEFKPLGDKILARLEKEDEATTPSGLVLGPGVTSIPRPRKAKVIAIGEGVDTLHGFRQFENVRVGDTILVPRLAGYAVHIDGQDYVMYGYKEIFGVYNEN